MKKLKYILRKLREAGLIASYPGAAGGYKLVAPAEQICLYDIVKPMEQRRFGTKKGIIWNILQHENGKI